MCGFVLRAMAVVFEGFGKLDGGRAAGKAG